MIAFITILYVGAVVLVFRVMRVRPRPWPIAAFALAGVLLIGGIVVVWTLAAPISERAVVSRYVVQIAPLVKGKVLSIPAKPNEPLRKGKDVLFQIDPAPYQYALNQARAQLTSTLANVQELQAEVDAAQAGVKKAQADVAATKFAYDADIQLQKNTPGSVSALNVSQDTANYQAAKAGLQQASSQLEQSRKALAAIRDSVPALQAQVDIARFNLEQCTMDAPADGFITDWQIREDSVVSPAALAAAGTFVDTSSTFIAAAYPAQELIGVRPGQDVELAFKSRPGRLFHGQVECIIQATGEGQFTPSGKLPSAAAIGSPGFLAVKIRISEGEPAAELEMGDPCTVAIYTGWAKPFALISKVAIRMQKWLYYLPLPSKSP